MLWLVGLLALAPRRAPAPTPAPPLHPVAAPADAASRYREAALRAGLSGAAAEPICRLLAEQLSVCVVKGEGGSLDYATLADAASWGMDAEAVYEAARAFAAAGITEGRPALAAVEGGGRYWVSAEADGLDAAGLLYPDRLGALAGAEVVVAAPVQGALLLWVPGDAELDKIMAVAVRRMYEDSAQRVSPLVYRWKDGRWAVWGAAVKQGSLERP